MYTRLSRHDNSIWFPLLGLGLIASGMASRRRSGTLLVAGGTLLTARMLRAPAANAVLKKCLYQGLTVSRTMAIDAPREYVYQFWKDFSRFPEFMQHLITVERQDGGQWLWKAHGPLGMTFSWQARVVADEENARISWESIEGSEIENHGVVEFADAPGSRGAFVKVELFYRPPAGKLGAAFASIFGENPEQQVREDLRRVKQIIETGEVPTTAGQPRGRRSQVLAALKTLHGEGREQKIIRSAS